MFRRPLTLLVLSPLLLYFILLGLAPLLVSTGVVRGALEGAVSEWSGHQATIGGLPELTFWPEPEITLPAVTIRSRRAGNDVVLARIERLSASFGLLDGMFGQPVLGDFRLTRPEFWLRRSSDGKIDWQGDGLLATAIRAAISDEPEAKPTDAPIGTVRMTGGRLTVDDDVTDRHFQFDDITARLDWPRLSSAMTLTAEARLGGRHFGFDLGSNKPLLLFGGKDAGMNLALRLQSLNGTFEGTANLASEYLLNGPLRIQASDLAGFLGWAGLKLRGTEYIKQAELSGELTTIGGSYRLDGLKASFDGSEATGIVELTPPGEGKASLGGTLAFDRIDLSDMLDAFMLMPGRGRPDGQDAGLPQWLDADLTLSADKAELSPFTLDDLAASIVVHGDRRRFDVLDGTFEKGRVTARLVDSTDGKPGEFHLSVADADLEELFDWLEPAGPLPYALASGDMALTFSRPVAKASFDDLAGEARLKMDSGTLRPFNLTEIRALAAGRPFFRLSDTSGGELDFDEASFRIGLRGGVAEILEGGARTEAGRLVLSGLVPYANNSLALAASLGDDNPVQPPLRLFIGGSWPDPILSPVARQGPQALE
ncbi:hypothetical protein M8R20_00410 [Pseudomonas sp. R2.Fl]|nr:hypothetical protein [Pseudomonas sp. R2.Fl]